MAKCYKCGKSDLAMKCICNDCIQNETEDLIQIWNKIDEIKNKITALEAYHVDTSGLHIAADIHHQLMCIRDDVEALINKSKRGNL